MTHWPEPTKQPYDWTNPIEIPQLKDKPVTQPRCDLCRFWELQTVAPNGRGYCNRFPPSIDSNDNWQWTEVDADERCGEFQPAAKTPTRVFTDKELRYGHTTEFGEQFREALYQEANNPTGITSEELFNREFYRYLAEHPMPH
jgi:hypothetical protein